MATKKTKAKEWFTIIAPKIFDEKEIGRTLVDDPEKLIGRRVILNMIELMNDFSKYYVKLSFRVNRVEGKKAYTEFDSSECLRDYISRMIIGRIRRIDTIQDITMKDGIKIRVKGLAIVPRRVKSSIQVKIRSRIKDFIKEEVENTTLDDFVSKLMTDDMKHIILTEIRKLYPVRNFEIRRVQRFFK
jgi:small subunit ribosomal protein S3Ae